MRALLLRLSRQEYTVVFLLCATIVAGLSYDLMVQLDVAKTVDQKSYWGLAHFDFEQIVVRKYRVIVPFLAAGLNAAMTGLVHLIAPGHMHGDFSLKLSFYCWNVCFTASWLTLMYRFSKSWFADRVAAFGGLLVAFTATHTYINAGTPLIDASYCLVLAATLVAIREEKHGLLFALAVLGPFVKEAYIFMVPVLLFSRAPKAKLVLTLALSAVLQLAYRYGFDRLTGHPMQESLGADAAHLSYIPLHLKRLLVLAYWSDLFGTFSFWPFLFGIACWLSSTYRRAVAAILKQRFIWVFLLTTLAQAVISGEWARMLFTGMPVYVLLLSAGMRGFLAPALLTPARSR